MATFEKTVITVGAEINAPVEKVWEFWTDPKHIVHWNNASDDWHTPKAENDLRVGGKFLSRMEARDGSMGFDFVGEYAKVEPLRQIEYTLEDDRRVQISFTSEGDKTRVTETFEAEQENSMELQQSGWQSIVNNFKRYVETSGKMETLHFEIKSE
ncbi:MAG: SRPBCC family protein [Bacteroidota bacterium]|nr:SRPBCC family protein [Bacteroidota bacterium]